MKCENVELNELPAPVEKILDFDVEDIHFKMVITDQILITSVDGGNIYTELNLYGNLCKIICRATRNNTMMRLESEPFEKSKVLEVWEQTKEKFVAAALKNKDKLIKLPSTYIPREVIKV